MRPPGELHRNIIDWINQYPDWFSYYRIDTALSIQGRKAKTLRRVVIKRLLSNGKLLKDPLVNGVYKRFTPAKRIDWQA